MTQPQPPDPIAAQQYQDISVIYRFLAQCLKYPDRTWLSEQFVDTLLNLVRQLGAEAEAERLRKELTDDLDVIETLQVEHTRLFINGVPHVAAPPYGAVYLDGSLQGPHTARTLTFYREKGYSMAAGADLPDHLVHELEFLSHLAAEGDQKGEQEFLEQLFRTWFPAFRDRVLQEARHSYYRMVINLIDFFTKEEE